MTAMELDEFVLARIGEDQRIAVDAAAASRREKWTVESIPDLLWERRAAEHAAHHDPARVLAECSAKRQLVVACRAMGPDLSFLGARPSGLADFLLAPRDQHQLAALTLALLALPYAHHPEYRQEWRP